jgi:hypothetical protein
MSTYIKIECFREERTTDKQWEEMVLYCEKEFSGVEDRGDFIVMDEVNCSYSRADLNILFADIKPLLKNSKITINMYYEEREPDETICLEDVA